MNEFKEAMKRHGSAVDAVLAEQFESWGLGSAMALLAELAREMARAEKMRRIWTSK